MQTVFVWINCAILFYNFVYSIPRFLMICPLPFLEKKASYLLANFKKKIPFFHHIPSKIQLGRSL